MDLAQKVDELHLQSAVLLEDEGVVGKRLPAHDVIELPFERGCRDALGRVEAGMVKSSEFGQAALRRGLRVLPW